MKRGPKPLSLEKRFWRHVRVTAGCWPWTGHKNSPDGYGQISTVGKRQEQAHRVAYRLLVSPIPMGEKVLHTCDNHLCVKPSHLYAGTNKDNTRDMMAKGRCRWTGAGTRKLTPELRRRLAAAAAAGRPARTLAREFKVSVATVKYHRSRS